MKYDEIIREIAKAWQLKFIKNNRRKNYENKKIREETGIKKRDHFYPEPQ
jgi:hypothetical protein